ncbi:Retrovirus-related Pol polyprotein from type-2 retrotransposable element R2DM [Schistosoma japonicum]|nr:Retrovirus-related Pol polyprotein from type-2 retrotransposable element R2DM [Schistosoma japonicum]
MRHRHVQEYNARKAAKVTSRRHSQWTNEEEDVLLDTANDIWSETPNLPKCQLYNRLSERLTGRSREAIKRRLLGLHWTPLASINGNTESNPQQRVDSERTVLWRAGLLEAVVRSCDRKHVLYKLAQALLRSRIGIDQGRSRLSTYVEKSYPYSKKAHRRPTTRADLDGLGEREINQINRTKLQKLLRRNKRCGAQQVLNGTWRNAYKGKPDLPVGFQTFWSNILSSGSVADDRPANELRPVDWTLIRPVTVEEVQRSLKRMGRTAPGPDGITPQQLYKRRHSTITALMNLILALEAVPEHLNLARIVFIPKCEDPQTPEDYRPISITSISVCDRSWSAMRHRHVQEYNARKAAKVTSRRHSQWTNEEEDVLLDTANDIWSETPNLPKCQLYNRLSERLTGRSREAIKRRLLGLHWTPLASINGNTESNPQQRVDSERTVLWRAGLLEAVVRSCDRKHVLYKLAQALLRSRIGIDQGRSRLSTYVEKSYPYSKKAHRRPTTRADLDGLGEREINQINRTKLQKLLRRNKRCGAQQVLNGTWRNAYKGKPDLPVGFQTFWSNILSSGSVADDRPANELRPVDWTLIRPVTVEEVQRSLKRMGRTAPGPDGITPQQLYKRRHSTITALMNLILALEAVPEHLNLARIVFIPKCEDPQTPEDYRPISITSVTLRCLHIYIYMYI